MQNPVDQAVYYEFDSNLVVAKSDSLGLLHINGQIRRKAGRPRGTKQAPKLTIYGNSLRSPMQPDNTHEFLISHQLVKTMTLLRSLLTQYEIMNVVLQFRPGGLYITEMTQKFADKSGYLSFFFDARYIHYYYCKEPLNVRISRDRLLQIIAMVKNETHFVLWRVKPNVDPGTVKLVSYTHVSSTSLDEVASSDTVLMTVPDEETIALPKIDEYYTFAFRTTNGILKSFSQMGETRFLKIVKISSAPLRVCRDDNPDTSINVPIGSPNIVYDHVGNDTVLSVSMPIHFSQTFCQQGDIGNNLQISLHAIDPIVLSYHIENTEIETQYPGSKGRSFPACTIAIFVPHMEGV